MEVSEFDEVIVHEDSDVCSPPINAATSTSSTITNTLAATTKLTPIPKLREPLKVPTRNSSSIGSSSKQRAPIGNYENYGKVEIIWLQYYPNSSMELAKGCKLHELKDELRHRELSLQGNKPEIIDRLCDHFKALRQNNEQTILDQQKKMYIALKLEYPPRRNTTPNTPKPNFLSPLLIPNNLMSIMAASQVTNSDVSAASVSNNNSTNSGTEKATQLIQQYAGMVPLGYLPVNTNNGVLSIPVGRVGPYYVYSPSSATSSTTSPYSAAYLNAYQQYQQHQYTQQIQNQLKQLQIQQQQQPMVISPISSISSSSPKNTTSSNAANNTVDDDDVFLNVDDVDALLASEQGQIQYHEKQTTSSNKRKYDELTVPDKSEDLLLRQELSPMKRNKPMTEEENTENDFFFGFLHNS